MRFCFFVHSNTISTLTWVSISMSMRISNHFVIDTFLVKTEQSENSDRTDGMHVKIVGEGFPVGGMEVVSNTWPRMLRFLARRRESICCISAPYKFHSGKQKYGQSHQGFWSLFCFDNITELKSATYKSQYNSNISHP